MSNFRNTSMAEQISKATGKPLPQRRSNGPKPYNKFKKKDSNYANRTKGQYTTADGFALKDKRALGKEGEGHINCTDESATELGRALSLQATAPFKHKYVGPFRCVEGFMWYLCSEDDSFRSMNGISARNASHKLTPEQKTSVTPFNLFKLLVADAYWQSIMARGEKFIDELKSSTLPFDMYYVDKSGIRIRTVRAEWLVHVLEVIRSAIQKNLSYPHFFYLFNERSSFGMKEVLGITSTKGADEERLSKEYEVFVSGLILDHFKDLIDLEKLGAREVKAKQGDALQAAKQIMQQTNEDLKEISAGATPKESYFNRQSQPDEVKQGITADAVVGDFSEGEVIHEVGVGAGELSIHSPEYDPSMEGKEPVNTVSISDVEVVEDGDLRSVTISFGDTAQAAQQMPAEQSIREQIIEEAMSSHEEQPKTE